MARVKREVIAIIQTDMWLAYLRWQVAVGGAKVVYVLYIF